MITDRIGSERSAAAGVACRAANQCCTSPRVSNALETLRLLSWIARGNRLGSIRYAVQEGDQSIRGTVEGLGRGNRRAFSLSCVATHSQWNHYITDESRDVNRSFLECKDALRNWFSGD